jgi:hypothetical protein
MLWICFTYVTGASAGVVTFGGNDSLAEMTLQSPGDNTALVPLTHRGDNRGAGHPRVDAVIAAVWMGFEEAYGGVWYTAKRGEITVHTSCIYVYTS